MRHLILFLTLIASLAHAEEWGKSERVEEGVFLSLMSVDALTTLDIKNHVGNRETNIILGDHPSDASVIGYFGLTALIQYLIVDSLPNEHRALVIGMTITPEIYAVNKNLKVGLSVRF